MDLIVVEVEHAQGALEAADAQPSRELLHRTVVQRRLEHETTAVRQRGG